MYAFSRIIRITHTIACFGKSIPIMPALLTYYAQNWYNLHGPTGYNVIALIGNTLL